MKLPESPPAQLARNVVARLKRAGHQAYLVGGCVRDLLLGIEPVDFDVATDAVPAQVAALFPNSELVGAHFGVVLVAEPEARVEVAAFRSDHAYLDGRHPESVRFETDPREDVRRRDFTVNALLLDLDGGSVLDFVDGRRDLTEGVIRTVGTPADRFAEDHLRMLRAVRFAARLGFTVEPATFDAIQRQRSLIRRVSAERVRDEILLILTEGAARRGFELLDETGLLEETLPEAAAMKGVEQPPEFHPEGDVWTHTLLMLGAMENPTPTLALGVLLHDAGKPPTSRVAERIRFDGHPKIGGEMATHILQRLKCSNEQINRVEELVRCHLRFMHVQQMRPSTLKRFLRTEGFEEHLELHRLDCLASHGNLENYEFAAAQLKLLPAEELRPAPLITGRELIRAGYSPGPSFRKILEFVETAQLESQVRSPEEALALVRSNFAPPDGRPPGPLSRPVRKDHVEHQGDDHEDRGSGDKFQ